MRFVHLNSIPVNFGIIFDSEPENIYPFSVESEYSKEMVQHYNHLFPWLMSATEEEVREKITGDKPPLLWGEAPCGAAIPRPIHDVICVGLNYIDHVKECHKEPSFQPPSVPTYFSKRATRVWTHGEDLPLPAVDACLDYEVELAVIIGKRGVNIPEDEVKDYIFGYAVYNDLSARTVQKETSQWSRGKGLDGLSAMSNSILIAHDGLDYPPKFGIRSYVNGELRQESTTDNLSHSIPQLISRFSQGTTLEAGDIFITGTPAGVAMGMKSPEYLKKGDVIRCEIDGVGILENKIV